MATDPQKQIIAALQRLQSGGGETTKQQAGYADKNASFFDQAKNRLTNPLTSVGGSILKVLERGSQLGPRYVDSLRKQGDATIARGDTSGGERLRDYLASQPRAVGSAIGGLLDLKGEDDVTWTKAVTGREAQSRKEKGLDLAGSILLDPTTYLGVGLVGHAGKAGKAAIAADHGTAFADKVAKVGITKLPAAERELAENSIKKHAAESADLLKGDGRLVSGLRSAVGSSGRTGAERFTQAASRELAQPAGLQLGSKTLISGNAVKGIAGATGVSKVAAAAANAPTAKAIKNLVTPRGKIADTLGKSTADVVGSAQARGAALVEQMNAGDLNKLKAALAGKTISQAANKRIDEALINDAVPALVKSFTDSGDKVAARYAAALDDVQKSVAARTVNKAQTFGPVAAREAQTLPGQQNFFTAPGVIPARPARAEETFTPGEQMSLFGEQAGREAAVTGGDPGKRVLAQAAEANKALGKQTTADALLEAVDEAGNPLAIRQAAKGYKAVNAGPLGTVYAKEEIAEELSTFYKHFDNDEALENLGDALAWGQKTWRNLALNTAPFGLGTLTRNAVSDVMMMTVRGGFKNPAMYKPAMHVEKAIQRASKAGKSYTEALNDPKLTPFEKNGLKIFLREGLIEGGIHRTDVAKRGIAATKKQKALQAVDISQPEALLTTTFSSANRAVSDVNRLALAFDIMSRTGNPALAVRQTKAAMIDYSDLTRHERAAKQYLIPFYTFAARNLGNVVASTAQTPGRVKNLEAIREAIFTQEDGDTGIVPDSVLERGQNPLLNIGGTPIFGNIESPYQAGTNLAQPVADLASLLPGQQQTEAGAQGAAGGILQNVGGTFGSAGKQLASEAAGADVFTGAPLNPEESAWIRLLRSQVPVQGRAEGAVRDLSSDDRAVQAARLLNLLGVSATANTEKRQSGEQYRRVRELGESAERQGIPSLTELREQGRAPKATTSKKTQKKSQKKKSAD